MLQCTPLQRLTGTSEPQYSTNETAERIQIAMEEAPCLSKAQARLVVARPHQLVCQRAVELQQSEQTAATRRREMIWERDEQDAPRPQKKRTESVVTDGDLLRKVKEVRQRCICLRGRHAFLDEPMHANPCVQSNSPTLPIMHVMMLPSTLMCVLHATLPGLSGFWVSATPYPVVPAGYQYAQGLA